MRNYYSFTKYTDFIINFYIIVLIILVYNKWHIRLENFDQIHPQLEKYNMDFRQKDRQQSPILTFGMKNKVLNMRRKSSFSILIKSDINLKKLIFLL